MIDGRLNGILPVNSESKVYYQIVTTNEGTSKGELFKRARKWFVKTYNSASAVLQVNDPASGELTGKGIFDVTESALGISHAYPIRHLISFEAKDAKYRITLTDFVVDDRGGSFPVGKVPTMGRKWVDKFYGKVDEEATALLSSLQKALETANDF